jgi:hypothetical protein
MFGDTSLRAVVGVSSFVNIQNLRLSVEEVHGRDWSEILDLLAAVAPCVKLLYLNVLGKSTLDWEVPAHAPSRVYPRLRSLVLTGNSSLIACFRGSSMPLARDISVSIHECNRRERCIPALLTACADTLVGLLVHPRRSFRRVLVDAPDYLVDPLFSEWDVRTRKLIIPDPDSAVRVLPHLSDYVRFFRVRGPGHDSYLPRARLQAYERLLEACYLYGRRFDVKVQPCKRLVSGRDLYQTFRPGVWDISGGTDLLTRAPGPSCWPQELRERWYAKMAPEPLWTFNMQTPE